MGSFRVEFDGDIRLCVPPPKSKFLMIFLDFFEVFAIFSFFSFFMKFQIFFSAPPPPPSRNRCRRGRGSRRGSRHSGRCRCGGGRRCRDGAAADEFSFIFATGGIIGFFFPIGSVFHRVIGGIGAIIFGFIIVYDTQLIFGTASTEDRHFEFTLDMYCREREFHVPPAPYRRQKKRVPLASIWT